MRTVVLCPLDFSSGGYKWHVIKRYNGWRSSTKQVSSRFSHVHHLRPLLFPVSVAFPFIRTWLTDIPAWLSQWLVDTMSGLFAYSTRSPRPSQLNRCCRPVLSCWPLAVVTQSLGAPQARGRCPPSPPDPRSSPGHKHPGPRCSLEARPPSGMHGASFAARHVAEPSAV